MTRLLLIRHGQSMANLERRFAGHFNIELSELGLKQAKATADFVINNYHVDRIYSSDLKRAYKTARALADKLEMPIFVTRGMREINAGEWEGREFDELLQNSEDFRHWREDVGSARPTGGESTEELYERVYKVICNIAEKNDGNTVAIATHATPIRVLETRISGRGMVHMKNIPWVTNASVTELIYDNGKLYAVKVSQDEHLKQLTSALPASV